MHLSSLSLASFVALHLRLINTNVDCLAPTASISCKILWNNRLIKQKPKAIEVTLRLHDFANTPLVFVFLSCTSGCVAECWTCNREVAGSTLGLGYFALRSTQPSIPPGSVNEYQRWLEGKSRYGSFRSRMKRTVCRKNCDIL